MKSLFQGCSSFEFLDLSNFNTGKTLFMDSLFNDCNSLVKLDISNFTLNKVISMGYMFYGCKSLTSLILPNFRSLSVTNTSYMFSGCSSLDKIDLSNFDSKSIIYMDYMFADCAYLKELYLYNWNTRKVITMDYLFSGCSSLTHLNISSFNTPELISMRGMFYSCFSLKNIDLSSLNFIKVKSMEYMFYKDFSISSINFDKKVNYTSTVSVENMKYMFAYCSNLEYLDLSFWNTPYIKDISFMFKDCTKLTSVNLSNFILNNVFTMEKMFENCLNIIYINLNKSSDHDVKYLNNIFDNTPPNMVFCINQNIAIQIYQELITIKKECVNWDCGPNYLNSRKKIMIDPNDPTKYKCYNYCKEIKEDQYFDYSFFCLQECPNTTFKDDTCEFVNDNACRPLKEKRDCTLEDYILNNSDFCIIEHQFNNTIEGKLELIKKISLKIGEFNTIKSIVRENGIFNFSLYNITFRFMTFSNKKKIDNISFIDFQDCESSLNKYQINDDLDLILLRIEYINEKFKIPIIEYKVFTEDGEPLDISVCNHIHFIYSIPVEINASEEYKYNPLSFYNNYLCSEYTTDNLTDIILYERRKEFNDYNLALCEINCIYLRYINGRVECECPIKTDFNVYLNLSDEEKDNLIFRFKDNHIEPYNFGVLKCFQMIFTKESFKKNYTNILFVSIMLLNVVSAFIFWVKEYKELYTQTVLLSRTIGTKPTKKSTKNVKIVKNSNLVTTGNNPPPKIKNSKILKNIDNNVESPSLINSKVKAPSNLIDSKNGLKNLGDKDDSFLNINLEEELELTLLRTDMEINMLSYQEAIKQDKRNCFIIYFSFLKTRQILFCIFTRDYNAVLFKISFFFFVFGTCIGINTIFFDDRLIQKIFEEEGLYSYQEHITSNLAPIIIAGVGASIIKSLVAILTFTDIEILSIKKKNKIPQEEKINKALMKVSSKSTTFFVINFIFMAIFWIYSSSFSAVFKNTQIFLLISGGISLGIVMFLPIFYYFIPALFRTMALNGKNSGCLYKFSQFVELI